MLDSETRLIERRRYFIRDKTILLWICDVIDYFIVPLDLWTSKHKKIFGNANPQFNWIIVLLEQYFWQQLFRNLGVQFWKVYLLLRLHGSGLNGAVSRNNRKRVAPCRCLDGHVTEPYKMSMALGARPYLQLLRQSAFKSVRSRISL